MVSPETMIISIVGAVFASTGFWGFVTAMINKKRDKDSAETKLLRALAHDRIIHLGALYVQRGWIRRDEYENFRELYEPYKAAGGNGTGTKMMQEVDRLPMREE